MFGKSVKKEPKMKNTNGETIPSSGARRGEDRRVAKKESRTAKLDAQAIRIENAERKKALRKLAAPTSSTRAVGYLRMYSDGICLVEDGLYSKTFSFADINYQTARRDDQVSIFGKYCELLNACQPGTDLQITIINSNLDEQDFRRKMLMPLRGDSLDPYREEMNDMLTAKALEGQNSIVHERYATVSTKAESYTDAKVALARIESDMQAQFEALPCAVSSLTGEQHLRVLYGLTHPNEKFEYSYRDIELSGLTSRSFIAPSSFDFTPKSYFSFGDYYGQALYLGRGLPADLQDCLLAKIVDLPINLVVTLHIQVVDQHDALEQVSSKIAKIDMDIMNKSLKANQQGLSQALCIPEGLKQSREAAEELLNDLRNNNQRMFMVTPLIYTYASSLEDLQSQILQITSVCKGQMVEADKIDFMGRETFNSILPLGKNHFGSSRQRRLTTASTAIMVPFTTQELFQPGGKYYGLNAISRNLICLDRTSLKAGAGVILGSPGSGKSFGTKEEMTSILLSSDRDEVLVIDPEREYSAVVDEFGPDIGEVIKISADSPNYLNPMEITDDYNDDGDPVILKCEFILSLCELLIGGRNGLTPNEHSIIDRAATQTYRDYYANPKKNPMPTLKTFYEKIKAMDEPEAKSIKLALEVYITGSLSVFSHRTNVDTKKRLVIFDIKDLGKKLKAMGMLIVLDNIWNRIATNRQLGIRTWIYIDEFQVLLESQEASEYFFELWSRSRKWGAIPTGITQNAATLLLNPNVERLFSNSDFVMMYNQAAPDRMKLAKILNISDRQLGFISDSRTGQGLLRAGSTLIPFINDFPRDTKLYKMMTTKLEEVVARK